MACKLGRSLIRGIVTSNASRGGITRRLSAPAAAPASACPRATLAWGGIFRKRVSQGDCGGLAVAVQHRQHCSTHSPTCIGKRFRNT